MLIGMLICVLSNLFILGYKLFLQKKNELNISIKDVIIMTSLSALLQGILIVKDINYVYFGIFIPYIIIQGYTDFKVKYVYRFTSVIYFGIAIIQLMFNYEHISIPIFICYGAILLFFIICSVFDKLGWGDTITVCTMGIIMMLFNFTYFIGIWLLIMLLASLSFFLYLTITKNKNGPFLPWLMGSITLVMLLYEFTM